MNSKSLNLIEEVITSFGMWDSLEIAQDSIYLEFSDVELGNPKYNDSLNLSFRFSDKSFIVFFYNPNLKVRVNCLGTGEATPPERKNSGSCPFNLESE